jgi:hypothetical protein
MQRNLQCVLAFVLSLGAVAAHGANGFCERELYSRKIPREFGACRIWEGSPDNAVIAYEETWGDTPDASQIERLIDTKDAIKRTLQFYATLHAVPRHPLVFVTDQPYDPRWGIPNAFRAFNVPLKTAEDLGKYCWVGVTPVGYSSPRLEYLQTVAHEMGHCLIDDYVGSVNDTADDGRWFEGMAEYLANQIFVSHDNENEYVADYDSSRGIFARPYRNMSFFQYYGNHRGGPRGVLEFARGFAEQQYEEDFVAVLGRLSGVEDFWHDFAEGSVEQQIVDRAPGATDGFLPVPQLDFFAGDLEIDLGSGSGEVELPPREADDHDAGNMFTFYIQQFLLTGPGIYRIEVPVTDEGDARSSFERGSGWSEMTEAVTIETCDQLAEVGVLLSLTSNHSATATPTIAYSGEPNPNCCVDTGYQDPCVVGTWELDASRLERFVGSQIRSHRRAGDAEAPTRGVEGLGWLRADGTGRVTSSMRAVVEVPQGPDSRMSITTESETDIDRTWSTRDGIFYSCRGEGSTIVLQTTDFRSDNPESGESTEEETYVKYIDGEVSATGGHVSLQPPRDADAEQRATVRENERQWNQDLREGGRRGGAPVPGLTAMPGPWDNAGRVPYTCSGDTLVLEMTPETELETRRRGSFTVPPLRFTLRRTSAPEPPRRAVSH